MEFLRFYFALCLCVSPGGLLDMHRSFSGTNIRTILLDSCHAQHLTAILPFQPAHFPEDLMS